MKVWRCYYGNKEYEDDGKTERTIIDCELSCCPDGLYTKSSHYDHRKDEEDSKRMRETDKYNRAMERVTPLHKTKQGKRKAA